MKVAYISGPYRASSPHGIIENIRRAEEVAIRYWSQGYAVICPHKNTALLDGCCPDNVWLDGDLEMVRRSDVIVMMRGWEKSQGAKSELACAEGAGIHVIYD